VLLRERFPDDLAAHKLRREIIATQVSNAIVNRLGPAAITRLTDETGSDTPTIAAAYAAARDSFGVLELYSAVDALDGAIPGALQLSLYARLQDLLTNRIVWLIRNTDLPDGNLEAIVARFRDNVAHIRRDLGHLLPEAAGQAWRARTQELVDQGVPAELASNLAGLSEIAATSDIVLVAESLDRPVPDIAATHFAVAEMFRLDAIVAVADEVVVSDYYDRLALDRVVDAINGGHRRLTAQVARCGHSGMESAIAWSNARGAAIVRTRNAVDGIVASGPTLSKLMVAASLLGDLARE
jgi:glutamate dehydrogenase